MSIHDQLLDIITKSDLDAFRSMISQPKFYINDAVKNGLLLYILENHKDIPITFIQVLLEHPDLDINKVQPELKLPALLLTDREDIMDALLAHAKCNVNLKIEENCLLSLAVKQDKMPLLRKLVVHPKIDLLQENENNETNIAFHQSMSNPEAFQIFLNAPGIDIDNVGWMGMTIPLEFSLKRGMIEQSLQLLERGADMNTVIDLNEERSIAEVIIRMDDPSLHAFVLAHLKDVKNKDRFIQYAFSKKQSALVDRLLETDCLRNKVFVEKAIGNIELMKRLIHDTAHLDKIHLFTTVLISKNDILLQELLKTEMAVRFKKGLITLLKDKPSVSFLQICMANDGLVLDDLKDIFIAKNFYVFIALVRVGNFGLLHHLVDSLKERLPSDFPPISILIESGHFDLVEKIVKNGAGINMEGELNGLLENNQKETILYAMANGEIDKQLFSPRRIVTLFEMFADDKSAIDILFDTVSIEMQLQTFLFLLEQNMTEELVRFITHPSFDKKILSYDMETFRPVDLDDNIEIYFMVVRILGLRILFSIPGAYKEEIFGILLEEGMIQRLRLPMLKIICVEENVHMLEFMRDHPELCHEINMEVNLSEIVHSSTTFVLEHIDIIFGLPADLFNFDFVMDGLYNCLFKDTESTIHSEIFQRVIMHPNFDPQQLDDSGHGVAYTQLQQIMNMVDNFYMNEPDHMAAHHLLQMMPILLGLPGMNINQYNQAHITALDHELKMLIRSELLYENKEYTMDEPFQMMIQMILSDPHLDMNLQKETLYMVCKYNLGYLFTHIISRPEFDINFSRFLINVCIHGQEDFLRTLLTMPIVNINIRDEDGDGDTPLHVCLLNGFEVGARLLIEDARIDLTLLNREDVGFAELASRSGMVRIIELLESKGIRDEKYVRMQRESEEYNARMAATGRVKRGSVKYILDIFEEILKEKENPEALAGVANRTQFSKTLCPFCMTSLVKEDVHECLYLYGHKCAPEVRNEALMRKYLGAHWETVDFEVCCTCGRPGKNHGHFRIVPDGEESSLAAPDALVDHWSCDAHNGGGGKLEMTTRLAGILTALKQRVDSEEHLEDNAELCRLLTTEADKALFSDELKARAAAILDQKAWNSNSTIAPYTRFNAPVAEEATVVVAEEREPIVHYDNRERHPKLACFICQNQRDILYRSHVSDTEYVCGVCLFSSVCQSTYANVTCFAGCSPAKQIYKEDVEALMDGHLCERMGVIYAEESAKADAEEAERVRILHHALAAAEAAVAAAGVAQAVAAAEGVAQAAEDSDADTDEEELEEGEIRDNN